MRSQMPGARYRLVIFDFDGTLADSFPWFIGVFNGVADRYGFRRIGERELDALRGLGGRELVRHLGVPTWKLPWIARHMRQLKARDLRAIALFPGVDALLPRLVGAGVELALVSSNSLDNVRRILGPENAPLFRRYQCGVSIFGKSRHFRRVLRRTGVAPGAALVVGDEIRDLEAARAAAIPFGAVAWGYTSAEALGRLQPEHRFASIPEIAETVLGARAR